MWKCDHIGWHIGILYHLTIWSSLEQYSFKREVSEEGLQHTFTVERPWVEFYDRPVTIASALLKNKTIIEVRLNEYVWKPESWLYEKD